MVVKIIILIGLARVLAATSKPLLCSGIYTGIVIAFTLLFENIGFQVLLIEGVSIFLLSSAYFWLLDRFEENMPVYFGVLSVGLVIGLV